MIRLQNFVYVISHSVLQPSGFPQEKRSPRHFPALQVGHTGPTTLPPKVDYFNTLPIRSRKLIVNGKDVLIADDVELFLQNFYISPNKQNPKI